MIIYENLFHGTTEGYIKHMSTDDGVFVSIDRYSSKPYVALGWARSHSKRFDDRRAIVNLRRVRLDKEIEGEEEDSLSGSLGADIFVHQGEILARKNPNIGGIRVYSQDEMEEFIDNFVDTTEAPVSLSLERIREIYLN